MKICTFVLHTTDMYIYILNIYIYVYIYNMSVYMSGFEVEFEPTTSCLPCTRS